MSEKVLGFKANDASIWRIEITGKTSVPVGHKILANKLVPVNLKSESVTLEWLDEYCGCNYVVRARELIAAAKKQAGEK